VLAALVADSTAPAEAQGRARASLVEALLQDGQLDSAAARLATLDAAAVDGEERQRLHLELVRAWLDVGKLDRAEASLGADSSVEAADLRGWLRLYHGDVSGAIASFRDAGPYTGDRDRATARTSMLALLEQLAPGTSPGLGAALLRLAQGDSAAAVTALRRAADQLPGRHGRADVLLLAGQVAARLGGPQDSTAAELFADVLGSGSSGAAVPAAELAWARLLLRQARAQDAITHLEHLILTYPGSAVVPDARRELERAKGVIPRS
jgi:tetratricopeptide (TPR) repeat protein